MVLRFKKKGKNQYSCLYDGKFYVASRDLEIYQGISYHCSNLKKFRKNPKGRSRSGFVVTRAEVIYDDVFADMGDDNIIHIFKNGKSKAEIHLNRKTIHKSKKNWLCELEKAHKSEDKARAIFAKHFKVAPDCLEMAYDTLRECVNIIHRKQKSSPYFRARKWGIGSDKNDTNGSVESNEKGKEIKGENNSSASQRA